MMAEILYESSYYGVSSLGTSIKHHGIKNQKWGVRRFQYENGILTPAGRARYDVGPREKTGKSVTKSSAVNTSSGGSGSSVSGGTHRLGKKDDSKSMSSKLKAALINNSSNVSKDYDYGIPIGSKGSGSGGGGKQFDPAKQAAIYALFEKLNPDAASVSKTSRSSGSSKTTAQQSMINRRLSKLLSRKVVAKNEVAESIAKKMATNKKLSRLLKQKVKRKIQNG